MDPQDRDAPCREQRGDGSVRLAPVVYVPRVMPVKPVSSQASLVMRPGAADEHSFPILDRIFVGRECPGIEEPNRILLQDAVVSRTHFEIRLDPVRNQAFLVDTSTNGTHVNGARVPRAVPHPIKAGDWIRAGSTEFAFRSAQFLGGETLDARGTMAQINVSPVVLVVGDITNYSTISQVIGSDVVAASLQSLYEALTALLAQHRGTLNHYAGDAIYAVWELEHIQDANQLAVEFALAASRRVDEIAPTLVLRGPDGRPVQMGWAVASGPAAITTMTHAAVSVVGDTTNLVFRLSGLAGRDGRAPVIVSKEVHDAVADRFSFGESEQVLTKGRSGEVTIYPVLARKP
jgi:adenylate cyclase